MDKIGLIYKLSRQLSDDWRRYSVKETTPETKLYNENLEKTLQFYKHVKKEKSPELMLVAEKLTLQQELATYAQFPEMATSIGAALEEMIGAEEALKQVQNPEHYQEFSKIYGKHKKAGLPIDAFREFVRSQRTRLSARLRAPISLGERNILAKRKECIKVARDVYVTLQQKALGKAQGLTR